MVDTGMGSHPTSMPTTDRAADSLAEALSTAGVSVADVRHVVNCHLLFDHCGGNPELVGRPIFTQRVELEAAKIAGYTLPELVDAAQALLRALGRRVGDSGRRVRRADTGPHRGPPVGRRAPG